MTIDPAAPGIFQISDNQAVATNAAGALITPSAPALAGSVIVVYLTGIGNLTTTPLDGDGAPVSPLARAALPATATLGSVDAHIEFLGLTPFFVGLAQANLVVPQLVTGNYPLVIAVNGVASAPVMISVAQL